ncbi:MAG: class II aldolase/adducin family protein [Kiritimatiellaeota bacterium]|nr:class II aldolase/adducin family protein [Kiritimatiellota bacterium]
MSIVKFKVEFSANAAPSDGRIGELSEWCFRFNECGLTPRLNGTGRSLGNLSFRVEPGKPDFIITGSTLDSKEKLARADFVKVVQSDWERKIVVAEGKRDPSSESMLHYEIYRRRPDVGAIFHGHNKEITANIRLLGLPETGKEALPGTAELLGEVMKILDKANFLVMKNHGFLALGKTMAEAGNLALRIREKTGCRLQAVRR